MATPGYTVNNFMGGSQQNLTSSPGITIVRVAAPGSAFKRFYIWELKGGQSGPPNATDCSVQWILTQCGANAAGTSTSATPLPTGGGLVQGGTNTDIAVTQGFVNFTAEPTTYTAANTFFFEACNQRGSVFWQAAPQGETYCQQTASFGPGLRAFSATYASTAAGRLNFSEV